MSKLSNALTMLDILSARSVVSLPELAETLELSHRGVQRLKDDLEVAGYNIETVMGPGGGYKLSNNTQVHPLAFSLQERKTLKQALSILIQQKNPSFGGDFVRTVSKLSNQLDYNDISNALAFQSVKLNVNLKRYQEHLEIFDRAIATHNRLHILYDKNHRQQNSYVFEPYELVIVNQFWYLLGYDEKGRYLSLKVNRVASAEILPETFRFDEETSHRGTLSDFGYKIKPVVAQLEIQNMDYISEYIWGKDQEITWLSDHRFLLKVEFPNEAAVEDFILKGGSRIKVIEPSSLREWVRSEALKTVAQYD
ncbi:WYL domain-containing transcriptional regulator [Erysipelothrix sp. HDW6C]|uniref:helix-turn-helix transcriptional regulator n=1 Tax=Erysipelothrix sp. HDW6C TaxID=2714930 RepID=UPI00140B0ADC|nr:WYL domain-containing transcriptional regulator [Erysipelothrix sp. HDW6C]QIK70533.1 WYL domain-containing transcriptional regulator [Erysipelothrix sp. HDW6C]